MEFADEIWVYTKGLCPSKDLGLWSMDFSMVLSIKQGTMVIEEAWPNAFDVNNPLYYSNSWGWKLCAFGIVFEEPMITPIKLWSYQIVRNLSNRIDSEPQEYYIGLPQAQPNYVALWACNGQQVLSS